MVRVKLAAWRFTEYNLMSPLRRDIAKFFSSGNALTLNNIELDVETYYSLERGQYDASRILRDFEDANSKLKTLIFTSLDIYIPIFTYVFGLAKLGGNTAIISSHRLKNEFYGLPKDETLLHQRLLKESFHELGHLYGLKHCLNYNCVMNSSSNNEELDLKGIEYCEICCPSVTLN